MNEKNTALIIVDMQKDFAEEQFITSDIARIIESYKELFANKSIPTYNFTSKAFGNTIPELKDYLSKVKDVTYLTKSPIVDSCFTNRKLLESLIEKGIDNVIVSGISAPYCVYGTAKMAKLNGFNVHSSLDLVATQKDRPEEMKNFEDWFYSNGDLCDSVKELCEDID